MQERIFALAHYRLFAGLLALALAAGCKAQPAQPAQNLEMNRRIEVLVRGQFNVPQDYSVGIGERRASQFPGYDAVTITFTRGPKSIPLEFLLSKDGKTLARLLTFDLTKDSTDGIDLSGRPIRGNPKAKVTIISFDDLECPYCSRMHEALFPSTLARYKDQIRFVYKDDPLTEIHPWAMHAAVDANCLAVQSHDAYWAFVDYVHANGQEVSGTDRNPAKAAATLDRITREQGTTSKLDMNELNACVEKQDESQVRASQQEAAALGIDGTPALFINGERITGWMPEQQIWLVIDRALRAAGEVPPPAPAAPPAAAPAGSAGK